MIYSCSTINPSCFVTRTRGGMKADYKWKVYVYTYQLFGNQFTSRMCGKKNVMYHLLRGFTQIILENSFLAYSSFQFHYNLRARHKSVMIAKPFPSNYSICYFIIILSLLTKTNQTRILRATGVSFKVPNNRDPYVEFT